MATHQAAARAGTVARAGIRWCCGSGAITGGYSAAFLRGCSRRSRPRSRRNGAIRPHGCRCAVAPGWLGRPARYGVRAIPAAPGRAAETTSVATLANATSLAGAGADLAADGAAAGGKATAAASRLRRRASSQGAGSSAAGGAEATRPPLGGRDQTAAGIGPGRAGLLG